MKIVIEFDDLQLLKEEQLIETWEGLTASHIKNEVNFVTDGTLIQASVLIVLMEQIPGGFGESNETITTTTSPSPSPAAAVAPTPLGRLLGVLENPSSTTSLFSLDLNENEEEERLLQVKQNLIMMFDCFVAFRSIKTWSKEEVVNMVGGAFNSDADRIGYITKLQETENKDFNLAFRSVNEISVEIDGVPQIEASPFIQPENLDGEGLNTMIIIAGGAGVAIFIMISVFFLQRRRNSSKNADFSTPPPQGERLATFVEVEQQEEDISTLGDPVYPPGTMFAAAMGRDETNADNSIVSADYDYARTYGGAGPESVSTMGATKSVKGGGVSTAGNSSGENRSGRMSSSTSNQSELGITRLESQSIFSDDASFERQYSEPEERIEIIAPTGKLGVVIDTPQGGVPMVHAIKDTSVLAGRVRVGDRLLSVDGDDTTHMTSIQVSKIISSRSQNPTRVLTFMRTRAGEQ